MSKLKSSINKKGRNFLWKLIINVKYIVKEVSKKIEISLIMIYQIEIENENRSPSSKLAVNLLIFMNVY